MKFISIHVTDLCNSACEFCVVAAPQQVEETVEYARILRFLEKNANSGFYAVNLHGGEPTVYPRFLELLGAIGRYGYGEIHLQTNAYKLADAAFLDRVIAFGVRLFIVSLHGSRPAIHDVQTGMRSGFDHAVRAIQLMRARGAKVRTNTVVTRTNLADLADTCRLACELDVNHINISNLHPVGSALNIRHRVMPSFSEMQPHIRAAVDCVRANRRKITLEGFPYCMVRDRAADHLNNSPRGIRMLIHGQVIDDYDAFMSRTMRVLGEECGHCAMSPLCGGAYPQYVELYGWSEFHAIGHPHELETAAMAQRSGGKVES